MTDISIEDDFSVLFDYFLKLFASKRMHRIYIRDFPVDYIGSLRKADGEEIFSGEYPDIEDDVIAIRLAVPGISKNEESSVTIYPDSVRCNDCSRSEMDDLVSFLDSSTFRYF